MYFGFHEIVCSSRASAESSCVPHGKTARYLVEESWSIHRTLSTISTGPARVLSIDKVDCPTLRCLRQQTRSAICSRPYNLRPNRTRLPELDQKTIKAQPLLIICFPNGLPDVDLMTEEGQAVRDTGLDLSKIAVIGSDGLECRGDPAGGPRIEPIHQIFEFYRLREVNRAWAQFT